ncbi:O-antigen ligase family protein [Ottowia sp.]|uniref:O-antigen ligase family protein n=1 Tax=Ottowia sp. TaxID=1898956 RepID=UPI002D1F9A57|nr:O-antigen ligase family protein [Ottowia sp.]
MQQFPLVRWVALFWGVAVFFPIGLNYTALVLLATATALRGDWRERLARLRRSPNWWPAWFFLGWTALVLALGPHYPETASNAFHALRIVLTLALVLALARDEALWAMRGFVLGLTASLMLVALDQLIGLPHSKLWESTVSYGGNKSLANALLMALAAVSGLLLMPVLSTRQRGVMTLLTLGSVAVLLWVLYSRTAWLIVVACLVVGLVHQLRARRQHQWLALVGAAALALAAGMFVPAVKDRLELGAHEVVNAYEGQAVGMTSSWGIRFRMYSETLDMMRERPLMGWGIGGWNTEWKRRVDGPLAGANMPHNDFLWMGAQTGVPGAIALFLMVAAGLPAAWQRHDKRGRMAVVALLAMLLATATNSALRDAAIGLTLWFIVLVYQRLSTEAEPVWPDVLPNVRL